MDAFERLKFRTGEPDDAVLIDCLECAKNAILSRRFPYGDWPDSVEPRYVDLLYRISVDLYNKSGAEGQIGHSENGISRQFESSWISEQLLKEIVPFAGVF